MLSGCKFCRLYVVQVVVIAFNQRPRCTQRDIKLVALQSSGVFDPRGSRQISMQAWLLGSLLAGIKNLRPGFFAGNGGRRFFVDILVLI